MNSIITEDVKNILSEPLPWSSLKGKTVLVTGANGMIPGYVIYTLMNLGGVNVIALSRSKEKLTDKFAAFIDNPRFHCLAQSITAPIMTEGIDIIFHGAGNTDNIGLRDMINTIDVNIVGTKRCLDFLAKQGCGIFIPFSSVSVFGLCPNKEIAEKDMGYADLQAPDAPYIQSKRVSEVYSYTYFRQYNVDVVIPRIPWTIGPGITRGCGVRSDFLYDIFDGKELSINSDGKKVFPFCYITDVISALFYILFFGNKGEPYNIVADNGNLSVRDFAELHMNISEKKNTRLHIKKTGGIGVGNPGIKIDNRKICSLGWKSRIGIHDGLQRTYKYILEMESES
jgi:nucleoside-diphosphate-sugar epimerase